MKKNYIVPVLILLTYPAGVIKAQLCPAGNISSDTLFSKCSINPVVKVGTGTWDNFEVEAPTVIKNGSTYMMWYEGEDTVLTSPPPRDYAGYAFSNDGITWTKNPNPVLSGTFNTWEHYGIAGPTVILDTVYKMWYCSSDSAGIVRIGYATSPNGITWTKYPNNPVMPVGAPGAFDERGVVSPHVIRDGNTYKMWYYGWPAGPTIGKIGYATSSDGITWTKYANNPVLNTGATGAFDQYNVLNPCVIKDGATYKMWYNGIGPPYAKMTIGFALSADGISWTRFPNPVIGVTPQLWDSVNLGEPSVIKDNVFKMWYAGHRADDKVQIGYAYNFSSVGIDETALHNGIAIYPNPASGQFIVNIKSENGNQKTEMKMIDLIGSDAGSWGLKNGENRIDITGKTQGIYILRFISGDNIAVKKLVIE